MKLSLNWLNDYVKLEDLDTAEVVNRLTLATCEVEDASKTFDHLKGVVLARVESVAPHPDADRLQVCQVDVGSASLQQIVCGAANVRPGLWVALAKIGASLPGPGNQPITIQKAKLRGVESNGMLCSTTELGLEPVFGAGSGLWEIEQVLPDDCSKAGQALLDLWPLQDTVLDIDNKSITHRPDLWCHFGFARELAAIFGRKLKITDPAMLATNSKNLQVSRALPQKTIVCHKGAAHAYFGMHLSKIQVRPSPIWMRIRLQAIGQRPINNIVDASNYVMFESGQPNHAFDADSLKEKEIGVQLTGKDYPLPKIRTLDDNEYQVPADSIIITDGSGKKARAVALGGIMGGAGSAIQDNTCNLFLESATFPREKIRRTVSVSGLRTDSSQRFEKGQDPLKARAALQRLSALIAASLPELSLQSSPITGQLYSPKPAGKLQLKHSFLCDRLGFAIKPAVVKKILTGLGFALENDKGLWKIKVPHWRAWYDVTIPEDIVEEIGRIHGYDNITPLPPAVPLQASAPDRRRQLQHQLKRHLAELGYSETYNYSFASSGENRHFVPPDWQPVRLANPVFGDQPELRMSQIPGLLHQAHNNQDRFDAVKLFELGRIYYHSGRPLQKEAALSAGPLPVEIPALDILELIADQSTADGTDHATVNPMERTYQAMRAFQTRVLGLLETWCGEMQLAELPADQYAGFHPHSLAGIQSRLDPGFQFGTIALLHPQMAEQYQLKRPVFIARLDFNAIYEFSEKIRKMHRFTAPSVHPDSRFEISVLLDANEGSHRPVAIVRALQIPEIKRIDYLTEFHGATLPTGQKSVSYRFTCQKPDASIQNQELNQILDRIVAALKEQGFALR
ncbi:MAG: phenylalanine--tRNA ligase subunit beta [Leptospiraceae bacterium]|nr:phenylalanine--tRNA ligase subunit beta [Leptospiraceae bacterium]